ncbi:MAG TPA: hypothetical protein VHZ95_14015, partial [Polyangiales bacterium]|nr:hypothetical protein [Polyangiales bacterium]
ADPKQIELEGHAIDPKDLARALRSGAMASEPIYIYADASLSIDRLRSVLSSAPKKVALRLVVRDEREPTSPPKAPRWLEEQLTLALAKPNERQARLQQLLLDHLALCDGARDAFNRTVATGRGFAQLPAEIVSAFVRCGCTTTNLDSLEATLHAMFGSPDLRFVRLPRALDEHRLPATATLRELAKLLAANMPHVD